VTRASPIPSVQVETLTAFELDGAGAYREVGRAVGDEEFGAARPFPVTIVPARLLDGLRP
jgi:hypothetical protein